MSVQWWGSWEDKAGQETGVDGVRGDTRAGLRGPGADRPAWCPQTLESPAETSSYKVTWSPSGGQRWLGVDGQQPSPRDAVPVSPLPSTLSASRPSTPRG